MRKSKKPNARLGFSRSVFADELLDGVEDLQKLFVVASFHGFNAAGQIAVGVHQAARLRKGAHDGDVDLDSTLGTKHARKHGDALFGEGILDRPAAALHSCGHKLRPDCS